MLKEKGLSVSESQDINQVIDYISKSPKHSRIKVNMIKLKENVVKGNDDISKLDALGTGSIILELQDIQDLDKED